ncbi:MAG: trypsin-like peptidase domain-containing protein [Caldilineaceae bacterium]
MTIQLARPDFQQLTRIVQNLPDFANMRDRRRLVAGAVEGVERAETILARLDLDGTPMAVAVEVVRFLAQFGQVVYGKEALGVFLNYIQPFVGDEDAAFIASLFQTYPLDAPVTAGRPIDRWRGTDSPATVQEKIIGENTLRHVYLLELALAAAQAVVHLRIQKESGQGELGTGFMVARDLLMTNHHVIATPQEAAGTEASFNYQLDRHGRICEATTVRVRPDALFYTNAELDFTVVQLDQPPDYGVLTLQPVQVRKDDRVAIIQHPGGHLKQIAMQNNFVAYADARVVQYTTSTLPGSSGAPVFNDNFAVVAIHHSGGMLLEPDTRTYYLRNAGTTMLAVLNDLKSQAPAIHAQLTIG